MTKVALALGSFTVGAVLGSLFLGIHTSTSAQALSSDKHPYDLVEITDGVPAPTEAIGTIPNGVPQVPPILIRVSRLKITNGGVQTIDGMLCDDCEFNNATIKYSGGAYSVARSKFTGKTTFLVSGAAANTLAFLRLMDAIEAGSSAPKIAPNQPLEQIAKARENTSLLATLRSPFVGNGK